MSQIEEIMHKAWEKGIQQETMSIAQEHKKRKSKNGSE
jgi:hypothetical protein